MTIYIYTHTYFHRYASLLLLFGILVQFSTSVEDYPSEALELLGWGAAALKVV